MCFWMLLFLLSAIVPMLGNSVGLVHSAGGWHRPFFVVYVVLAIPLGLLDFDSCTSLIFGAGLLGLDPSSFNC